MYQTKIGGAAITCKNELEKINEKNVETVSLQLRQAMITGCSSLKVVGMDWSKRPGITEDISYCVNDFGDQPNVECAKFVVVHGAGLLHSFHYLDWIRPFSFYLPKFYTFI